MTLWCFGDSYVDPNKNSSNPVWTAMIGEKLNCSVQNLGMCATSLDYTYMCFDSALIQERDHVIIVLTDLHRRFFFLDSPETSSLHQLDNVSSNKSNAMKHYFTFLSNPKAYTINLKNFLYRVQSLSEKKNLKTVVFNAFVSTVFVHELDLPNLHIVPNTLFEVSQNEISRDVARADFVKKDPRANHLCVSNHKILADKVVNYVTRNTPITLNNMLTNIVTRTSYFDQKFRSEEFASFIQTDESE